MGLVPCQGEIPWLFSLRTLPSAPLSFREKDFGLGYVSGLLASHSCWLKPCTPATPCPPCCSCTNQAYCCHSALALTAPLAWNTPPQVSTWFTISLPSDLCSRGIWSAYQWGVTHHPYKMSHTLSFCSSSILFFLYYHHWTHYTFTGLFCVFSL